MIVFFDTVRRKRPVQEGGELVKLDWTKKKVLEKIPIFPTDPDITHDPNPRGNSRGGKGMITNGNDLLVGTYHSILVFDFGLNLKRKISNNLFVNLHEMCMSAGNIWTTSTTIDCALLVTDQGQTLRTWWPREIPQLQQKYNLLPMEIDKNTDNRLKFLHAELSTKESHTHLNAVFRHKKNIYVLLNRLGAIVQIEPNFEIILQDQQIRGSHSPVITADGKYLLVGGSFRKVVFIYDLNEKRLINSINLLDFKEIAQLYQKYPDQPYNKSIFVRGLEILNPDRILLGIAPASILEIDIQQKKLIDFFQYSKDVGDAVHGLVHIKNEQHH